VPSKSKAQAHLMAAVAHGWEPPGKRKIPQSVGAEFHAADKKVGKWEHKGATARRMGSKGRMERLKGLTR
jgi:hypothetical protein